MTNNTPPPFGTEWLPVRESWDVPPDCCDPGVWDSVPTRAIPHEKAHGLNAPEFFGADQGKLCVFESNSRVFWPSGDTIYV